MFGAALRQVMKHPIRATLAVASEPLETWTTFAERIVERGERRRAATPSDLYRIDLNWEAKLHHYLQTEHPCVATQEFWRLWTQVLDKLQIKGISVGPESYLGWNDGDAGLARAIWCITRHTRPCNVVETGVAHGVTSRFILEALDKNGDGHLWSIDRPPLLHEQLHSEIGCAVDPRDRKRWSYIRGSSRRRLPGVLAELGEIDLFVHDSLHSEQNVRFEMESAWAVLREGGALVVDDIDANAGFHAFIQAHNTCPSMVCEAEPIRPDLRRFNKQGLFGIVLKVQSCERA